MNILDRLKQRVFILDGAMGTSIHNLDLTLDDYRGCENCSEVLNLTRPELIRDVHRSFLSIGSDAVMTNSFGGSRHVLAEFDLQNETYEINRRAAEMAKEACRDFQSKTRPRYVIGSVGPGTKLPTLGQIDWDNLLASYEEQVRGLIDGGVDALVIETCQDILQTKCALAAATDAMKACHREVPIFCTVTIETTGTMLVGTDIAAALTALHGYRQIVAIGLNCATGPQEMSEHLRYLSRNSEKLLIVQPNAGLPQLIDGQTSFPLTPDEFTRWLVEFVENDGVNIVGGCCGTTPEHLAMLVDALGDRVPGTRKPVFEASVSSVYQSVTLAQENTYLAIGERTNANGSKQFRRLLGEGDWDGMVQMAREQAKHGSHLLDVCTAYVGRDEVLDMCTLIKRLAADVTTPLVIDSTEVNVIEDALKLAGGKCVINSINLEDGEDKLDAVCRLAARFNASLIALTIDEDGMAKEADRKVEVAKRIYDLVTNRHGIDPRDLLFDPLTFTICTGNEDDRRLGLETIDALSRIKEECPGCSTLLGLSNISFGIKPPARRVLNSVFLHHCRKAGLDSAIVHVAGILPLFKIDDAGRKVAEDLIFDRRSEGYDPLVTLLEMFEDAAEAEAKKEAIPQAVDERLKRRIIDGDRIGLEEDLDEAMQTWPPLGIVNEILLDGMRTVGDLFGAGQMQLPFVLQSAETMKAAVRHLEPFMEKVDGAGKGIIVLATVQGDVHDIGKNLVDIILTNNGYTVHNIGIKQPINSIIDAFKSHNADAIGMSGLLVKSTVVMRENLAVMKERGLDVPVILGGAALTRKYVEQELRKEYDGSVFYAKDAFAGLNLMDAVMAGESVAIGSESMQLAGTASAQGGSLDSGLEGGMDGGGPTSLHEEAAVRFGYTPPRSNISREEPVPEPPFWGSRVIQRIDPKAALAYLNENMLFQVQWQYRKNRRSPEEFKRYIDTDVRPILRDLLARCEEENILDLQAIYGFWPAQADGDQLLIFDPDDREKIISTFEFPRQGKPPYWCLSDFFRPLSGGVQDVVGFSVVTAGRNVSDVARQWFEADRYKDYLHLHGLGVETAEALAEYIHKQVRIEWGIAGDDAREKQEIFKQRYRGSRYSFGYPACPRLEDQLKIWPLLQPERIGVTLSNEFQLEPEQTTTALISHHRQAKYFNVR